MMKIASKKYTWENISKEYRAIINSL